MVAAGIVPALGLLIGATLGLNTGLDAWVYAALLLPTCLCALVLWWWHARSALLAALSVGFLAGGAALAADARERALLPSLRYLLDQEFGDFLIESIGPAGRHDPLLSRIVLAEDAARREGFVSLRADIAAVWLRGQWRPVEGGLAVSVNGSAADDRVDAWRAGRMLEAPVTFRRPTRYLNDGVPDFERDQALGGVVLLGTIKSGLLVDVVERGGIVAELAADIRAHVRRAVGRWIGPHGPTSAAIASAVLIGDRTGLPDETREALQAAGTYHVIAISGGNIAILAAVTSFLLLIAGVRGRAAARAAIVVLGVYALVISSGPSVWRATLMAVLYFWARALDHRSGAWQTASVAAAVMVVVRPLDIRDPGFILTFGATLALLESGRIGVRLTRRGGLLSWIAASMIASFAIEAVLLPVSALLFSRVTSAGLLLNLAAVPLMGVVQIAALVTTVTDRFPAIAGPAGWISAMAAQGLVGSANLVTLAPWSTARVPPPGAVVIAIYYTGLAIVWLVKRRAARLAGGIAWVVAALAVIGTLDPQTLPARQGSQALRMTMFDVGQGEAILIETPSGGRLLVDSGGTPFGASVAIGASVLAPALWARGIRSFDTMLITHGDPDHLGGAVDVLTDFAPHRLSMGVPVVNHHPMQEVLEVATGLGVPADTRRRGEMEADGELRVRVLHPPSPDWERRRVRNDDSVVLEIVYRDVALLLTGDISSEIEREILPQLTHAPIRILKVAHHGSRTSSSLELLSEWRPQWALISAGRGNTFGHPAPEVLQRLDAIGAKVLRTDSQGQITVETDGHRVTVKTFVP